MPNYVKGRPTAFLEELSQHFQGLLPRECYLPGRFHTDFVRADDVVFYAPGERFVVIKRMLVSILIDDDISIQLPILSEVQPEIGEQLIGGRRVYFLSDLEAAHHILVNVPQFACDEEEMVALLQLLSDIRSARAQCPVRPEIGILDVLAKLRVIPAARYHEFPSHRTAPMRLMRLLQISSSNSA
jgi:hypothetical protein